MRKPAVLIIYQMKYLKICYISLHGRGHFFKSHSTVDYIISHPHVFINIKLVKLFKICIMIPNHEFRLMIYMQIFISALKQGGSFLHPYYLIYLLMTGLEICIFRKSRVNRTFEKFSPGSQSINFVQQYKYLGILLNQHPNEEEECYRLL